MPYDEFLAERVNQALKQRNIPFFEKKMFGGLAFMVDNKMCLGVNKEQLMARTDPELYEEMLKKEGAVTMEFTGRPMKGFIFVNPDGVDTEEQLGDWVECCLEYNPRAKASPRRK
ncbi:MAG: RNA methyltransferase, partial [Bacteroidetes bacterium]